VEKNEFARDNPRACYLGDAELLPSKVEFKSGVLILRRESSSRILCSKNAGKNLLRSLRRIITTTIPAIILSM
jgi:hypothetical protein